MKPFQKKTGRLALAIEQISCYWFAIKLLKIRYFYKNKLHDYRETFADTQPLKR